MIYLIIYLFISLLILIFIHKFKQYIQNLEREIKK